MTTKQRKAALVKLNELAAAKRAPMPADDDGSLWTRLHNEWQALHTALFANDDAPQVDSLYR